MSRPYMRIRAIASHMLRVACVGVMSLDSTGSHAQTPDSATSACRQNPSLCLRSPGEELVVPTATQRAAEAGASVGSVGILLNTQIQTQVERALVECADKARSQVLMERLQGQSPNEDECNQWVPGANTTLAKWLGQQMHHVAAQCAQERLARMIPGRFSLEPRYRYDTVTGRTTFISEETAQLLLQQGRGNELKGTLRPDVVIHSGDPTRVQAVYDFKFGCTGNRPAKWTQYPEGHPYEHLSQGDVYKRALHPSVWRVTPRWGIMP